MKSAYTGKSLLEWLRLNGRFKEREWLSIGSNRKRSIKARCPLQAVHERRRLDFETIHAQGSFWGTPSCRASVCFSRFAESSNHTLLRRDPSNTLHLTQLPLVLPNEGVSYIPDSWVNKSPERQVPVVHRTRAVSLLRARLCLWASIYIVVM